MNLHVQLITNPLEFSLIRQNREIVAYNASSLLPLWTSQKLAGLFQGNPIVSTDGLYTFLVTNSMNKTKANFIVVNNGDGSVVFMEESQGFAGRPMAYAPLGVGRNVERGNWNRGGNNNNDMLVWGELFLSGRGEEDPDSGVTSFDGALHYFQLPPNFDPNQNYTDLSSETGNMIMKVTLSSPTVPRHGRGAFFAFNSGQIRGWSQGKLI